jgi:hypothetical protein
MHQEYIVNKCKMTRNEAGLTKISDVLPTPPANKDLYDTGEREGADLSFQQILQMHQKYVVNKCKMMRNEAGPTEISDVLPQPPYQQKSLQYRRTGGCRPLVSTYPSNAPKIHCEKV